MPPAHPRSPAATAPVPTSAVVTLGSAPRGTFSIPEDGLHVSEGKSFLARFQAGTRIRAAKPAAPHQQPNDDLKSEFPKPDFPELGEKQQGESPVKGVEQIVEVGTDQKQDETKGEGVVNGDPGPETGNELKTDVKLEEQHEQEERLDPEPEHYGPEVDPAMHEEMPSEAIREQLEIDSKVSKYEADEAEDTLINEVNNDNAISPENRTSYPVLRFCSGVALLDQHALDTLGLPLGFVWAPFGELRGVQRVDRSPNRCGTCGSFVANGNGGEEVLLGSRVWTCEFCGRNDNDSGDVSMQANVNPQAFPELRMDTIEYSHPDSATRTPFGRGAIVLIVDENLDPEEAVWARAATAAVHASATEKGLQFALITVGFGCSVAVRHKQNGEATPVLEMMSPARAAKLTLDEKEAFFLTPPQTDSSATSSTQDEALIPLSAYTDAFINPRYVPATEEGNGVGIDPCSEDAQAQRKERWSPETEARRLDIAISIAFELISGMADSENSRILSVVTGPPTLEEDTPRHRHHNRDSLSSRKSFREDKSARNASLATLYDQIGSKAGDLRVALDFLCFAAPDGFACPVLLGAAKRSRGGLVYSATHSFSAASALAEAASYLSQRSTSPGVVSIRVSAPLAVARAIGPAFPTAAPHTYAVPGIDPTIGFTVVLKSQVEVEKDANYPTHAVVQLAAKSLEATRVVTARIPLSPSSEEYLGALDAEICALVLGKACIVSGGALTQPLISARSIDVTARRLLRGSEASAGVARLLFELRHGLLIEKQVSPDCSLVLRSFFLRAESALASLLMSPRLFTNAMSDERTGLMAEVPLEKSYITKDAVLVLDSGFNVFVYVGEEASAESEEAISESARSVAAQRVSPCQLWKLRPGPDAEYLLDSYLSPSGPPKGGAPPSPTDYGFIQYCKSLAPDSITVRLLQSA